MNQTIQSMTSHRSIRKYLDKDIPDSVLQDILRAAQSMPSSDNGQQVSVIVIRDQATKIKLAALAGGQPWIISAPIFLLFIVDFYKTHLAAQKHDRKQIIHESAAGAVVGILDCGIALGGTIVAAESLGLGTVAIGGIRSGAKEVIELLNLPKYTFPVNGLCIGYPAHESMQKPRLAINSFAHIETYCKENLPSVIDEYDELMKQYLETIGRSKEIDWSSQTSNIYKQDILKHLKPTLEAQGFTFK